MTTAAGTRSIHTLIAAGAITNAEASTGAERLRCLRDARRAIEDEMKAEATDMRRAGATWAVIGRALGVTRSAAQQKYGA